MHNEMKMLIKKGTIFQFKFLIQFKQCYKYSIQHPLPIHRPVYHHSSKKFHNKILEESTYKLKKYPNWINALVKNRLHILKNF